MPKFSFENEEETLYSDTLKISYSMGHSELLLFPTSL